MKYLTILSIIVFALSACHSSPESNLSLADYESELAPVARQDMAKLKDGASATNNPVEKRKLIKDGDIDLRVTNIEESKFRIDSLLKVHNAYYGKEEFYKTDYSMSYSLTIRIPNNSFDKFIVDIENGTGEILSKSIDVKDVTTEFIDLETRLKNKRQYLNRYRELLKKASTIKEILSIEEKIRLLEEEIESTEGRLKYLGDLVAYSTLNLNISKQVDYKYKPKRNTDFAQRFKKSLSGGWNGFVGFVLFLVNIWPVWFLLPLGIYLFRKIIKRMKSSEKE